MFDIPQILASKSGELKFVEKFIEMGADVTALDQEKVFFQVLSFNITTFVFIRG